MKRVVESRFQTDDSNSSQNLPVIPPLPKCLSNMLENFSFRKTHLIFFDLGLSLSALNKICRIFLDQKPLQELLKADTQKPHWVAMRLSSCEGIYTYNLPSISEFIMSREVFKKSNFVQPTSCYTTFFQAHHFKINDSGVVCGRVHTLLEGEDQFNFFTALPSAPPLDRRVLRFY